MKLNKFKYISIGLLTASLYFGLKSLPRQETFSGNFKNGEKYVYREFVPNYNPIEGFYENVFFFTRNNKNYTLFDKRNETSINWKDETKPEFEKDTLEKVIIEDGDGKRVYELDGKNDSFEKVKAYNIIATFSIIYNEFRSNMRNDLRTYVEKNQKTK